MAHPVQGTCKQCSGISLIVRCHGKEAWIHVIWVFKEVVEYAGLVVVKKRWTWRRVRGGVGRIRDFKSVCSCKLERSVEAYFRHTSKWCFSS